MSMPGTVRRGDAVVNIDEYHQRMASDDLSAAEAAALLGVSRATLYAYVSRGLLASEPGPGPSRARRYPRAAVDELLARRARARDRGLAAHGALHWGLPVLDSALTLIEDGRLWYRGHDAIALAREAGFEEVAALLWTGERGRGDLLDRPGEALADGLEEHLVVAGRRAVLSVAGPAEAVLRDAARLVAGLVAAAGGTGDGPLAVRLARGWGRPGAAADIDAALVLCADHELNISSFTARCVASADAGLAQVVLAALCALRGRRHGGMTTQVEALVADAERDGPRRASDRALGASGTLPGFGHPLYPEGDPRGAELLRRAGPGAGADDPVAALVALARDVLGAEPTLDLGLAALARARGLPPGSAFALFALGRTAGWIAHALEAAGDARLIRPRSRYTGPRPDEVGS
jgi:citrate synthase